jgi:hypothetical protein
MRRTLRHGLFLIGCAVIVVVGATTGRAQPAGGDVLTQLLTEVRGLRAAMEQMASAGPRVQLVLGRLQLQEQRVNTLVRRQESVRSTLSASENELAQHQVQQG